MTSSSTHVHVGVWCCSAAKNLVKIEFLQAIWLIPLCLSSCKPGEKAISKAPVQTPKNEVIAMEPDDPVPFGYKCAWLAIKNPNPEAVVNALGLVGAQKCGWKKGIEAAYRGEFFITPAVNGWVLVVSIALPEIPDKKGEDRLLPLIAALGQRFHEVQYFGTHRIVEYHGWAKALEGKIVRRYAFLGERGETLCNEGPLTQEERKLDLIYSDSKHPSELDVMKLAGAWSINPKTLDELGLQKGIGSVGTLPKK
jgi:hypothetical protein